MKMNKIEEVWNSVNLLLKWIFGLLSFKNFATMAAWHNDFSSLLMRPLGVSMHVRSLNFKTCHSVTVCIEEELAMYLSAFFYFCFCLCRCCSFNPPSCCLLPYTLTCLMLSFQSHAVCWNFTLTGLHQCGDYGHNFLVHVINRLY